MSPTFCSSSDQDYICPLRVPVDQRAVPVALDLDVIPEVAHPLEVIYEPLLARFVLLQHDAVHPGQRLWLDVSDEQDL